MIRQSSCGMSMTFGRGMRAILLASTVLMGQGINPVLGQEAPAQGELRAIQVPSGPLTLGLNSLAAQAGLQILFDASLTQGKVTPGVSGTMTAAQALNDLLAGTGITSRFAGTNQVILTRSPEEAGFADENAIMLGTIILYGNRTGNTLNSTTASVGIVSAADIEQGHVDAIRDGFRRLGNVQDSAYVNSGFVIRGLSSEGFSPGGIPLASLYIDGVQQTRVSSRRAARNLWDAEQLEVYRGPQSTMTGRAAMAGAIYVKTKDPTFEKEAEVAVTAGSNDLRGLSFVLNTPLIEDQLAFRLSGSFEKSRDPIDFPAYVNFAGYDKMREDRSYNLRGKLLYTPTALPNTSFALSFAFSDDRQPDRFVGFGTHEGNGDFYQFPTYAEIRPIKAQNYGFEIIHDFSDSLRFTSFTGLHNAETHRQSVDLGTPGVINGIDGIIDDRMITQEFRLNYEGDGLSWVAGFYGSHQKTDTHLVGIISPLRQTEDSWRKTTNYAIFGEANWEFVPSWNLILGGRIDYLTEKNWYSTSRALITATPVPTITTAEMSETNFVPKIGISHEFADGNIAALTYSEGFRSGGYYTNYRTGVETYGPEKAQNLEISYKGRLLDDRLTLNANLFYTKYRDQQIEIRPDPADPFYRETSNAASSRSWGFEIEPSWQANNFTAFASIGYLNTKFEEFDHASYGDLSGQPFPEAPEWTIGIGGRYHFDNGFWLGADAKYSSDYLASFGIAPQDKLPGRVIANLQAGYDRDNWAVTAWVDNLFDKEYFTGLDREATPAFGQLGPRRTVGITLTSRF